jgi:hypothetical protein
MPAVSAEEAIHLARHVAPEWIEERGCVLRKAAFSPANFEEWWETTGGDVVRVEAVINHVHLWDLLPATGEGDFGELWELGEVMVVAWKAGLAQAFPDRAFDVVLSDDYGPTVSVVSAR